MRETAAKGISDETMGALSKVLAKVGKTKPRPLSVMPNPKKNGDTGTASWERHLIDPAIVELALSLDVPLAMPPGPPRSYTFWLYPWHARRSGKLDELRLVGKHPFFSQVLAASFLPTRETKDNVVNWLAKAVEPRFREGFKVVFDELDTFGKTVLETWTVGALEVHAGWIEGLCQPEVFALCPSLAKAVRELSAERLLRNQLRAGIMDEWGYQAQDDALALFPPERHRDVSATASGPLPYHVLLDTKEGRIVAFGPEGIVLDRPFPAAKKMKDVRNLLYSGGDVLVCEYKPSQARWAFAGGKPFEADPYGFHSVATPDGQVITRALKIFPVGSRDFEHNPHGSGTRIWCDGVGYYAHAQEVAEGPGGVGFITFDPTTGKKTGHGLPPWMAELVGPRGKLIVHIEATFIVPVPKGAEQSPFGAKGGFGGFALYKRDGQVLVEGIDGRKRPGLVNGLYTAALMTFPAREGFYPVVESAFDIGIAMPDGTTPLVPMDALRRYWMGTPHLSMHEWYCLRPRDLGASKALAVCSDETAKALFDAAMTAAVPPAQVEEVKQYGKMQVVMTPAHVPQATPSVLADAIRRALPVVKHPRMVEGIAGIARAAVKVAPIVARLKSRVTTTTVASAGAKSSLRNDDAGALARLFEHERPWWNEKLGIQLGQQILDASHFLFEAHDDAMVTPAPTIVPWPLLLTRIGEVLYRVLAPGTPKSKRSELVKVLELWLETGFPSHVKTLRLVDLAAPSNAPELAGLDREHAQRLLVWGDRFFVSWSGVVDGKAVLHAIQAATGASFDVPKGVTVTRADPADARFDVGVIRKTLGLLELRGPAKLDLSAVERFAKKKKLSKAAATLLWAAGYDPWLVGEKKLATFQVERDSLDSAEKELKKLPLAAIYTKAMPSDPTELYDASMMADRLLSAFSK